MLLALLLEEADLGAADQRSEEEGMVVGGMVLVLSRVSARWSSPIILLLVVCSIDAWQSGLGPNSIEIIWPQFWPEREVSERMLLRVLLYQNGI